MWSIVVKGVSFWGVACSGRHITRLGGGGSHVAQAVRHTLSFLDLRHTTNPHRLRRNFIRSGSSRHFDSVLADPLPESHAASALALVAKSVSA